MIYTLIMCEADPPYVFGPFETEEEAREDTKKYREEYPKNFIGDDLMVTVNFDRTISVDFAEEP